MTEMGKTCVFVVGGIVALGAAWLSRSSNVPTAPPPQIGKPLFAEFEDPYEATRLDIVEYNDELGEIKTFEIAQKSGRWVIPSHDDYPADAEDNLKEAATMLIDLTVVHVASDSRTDHELFGVVAPDPAKTELGDKGVGELITMKDAKGNRLADLVIGKKVKDNDDQRFVRKPGEDRVYVVEVDPEKVSTKFEDWIEEDLLDMNAWDIEQMVIRDYSVDTALTLDGVLRVMPDDRLTMTVNWNADDFKWELGELLELQGKLLQPVELLDNEELNKEALDGVKTALDDLKIVDVRRKPEGLKADLTAQEGISPDSENYQSLMSRGFYLVQNQNRAFTLLSGEGEVKTRTKDGVEYMLRFGGPAVGQEGDDSQLNRFVMVTASVHEPSFQRPEPPENAKPATSETDATSDEQATDDTTENADDADEQAETPDDGLSDTTADADNDDAVADTDSGDEESTADAADEGSEDDKTSKEDDEAWKEYERKLDEYNEKRKTAEDKVRDLSFRFAPWYYVISEDVYKKIHLGRSDVIKEKEGDDVEGTNIDDFRDLEEKGLTRESDDES